MPNNKPDALIDLLVNKYGAKPDEAASYAESILGSWTQDPDTHDSALQSEALGNVAVTEMDRMRGLQKFPAAVGAATGTGPIDGVTSADMDAAIDMITQSQENTRKRVMTAGDKAKLANMPAGSQNIPVQRPPIPVQAEMAPTDPYQLRLNKAMALRKAALGY